ncbi:acyl-CoA dehydrogenase family protein [Pseudobacteriovorax antillogorgiicola]|uniref:glutaryl-CoA dehydrogenase (ETF) n=1 Tax=Pseudobacteriovorax antillogorgiicola TaxID=1513793 RepID=A0A1Y6C7S4_9BACT|nr:acyl-CoA dehydrogenase family protein [Pseudobacteriovorax antillogorgiicola]TCS49430.1 glutaryl-CoA dehydrogenase [Pseudobacteriovorax antillogorgiicola]SMF46697.1 glutaryl-CoA dehydrogenase [Pseudobacteriovorax antillogorgiicola]
MKTPHCHPYPDYMNISELLTEEQNRLLGEARRFVEEELEPSIADHYEAGTFPKEAIARMGEAHLIGSNLAGYGLPGYDEISYGLIMRELERCDSAFRSCASVQGSLVMYPIAKYGSDEQKDTWLERLGKGSAIGSFALTEPQGGSDPGSMETRAEDRGDHWLLSGEKRWVTNGTLCDVVLVWARTDDGVRGFLCPADTPGVKFRSINRKLSLRASASAELSLDQVKLPKSAELPAARGLGAALNCLNQARYGIVWGVIGAAEACYDEALSYAQERQLFQKKLSQFQMVQGKLADMTLAISQGQLLALRLGQLKNAGQLLPGHVSLGKQGNVKAALEIARTCRDILGANGVLLDYKTMRHACNLETVFTYEGTHDIHRLVVGQQVTGKGAFS